MNLDQLWLAALPGAGLSLAANARVVEGAIRAVRVP